MNDFINKNRKIILLVISIGVVLTVLVNSTYSLLFKEDQTELQSYTTGVLDIKSNTTNNSVKLSDALPMSDADGLNSTPYTFKITNTGTLNYKFDLKLLATNASNLIDSQYIRVSVNDGTPVSLSTLSEGKILENISIYSGRNVDVTLRVWLDINTPNTQIGKSFNAKIVTEGYAIYTNDYIPDEYQQVEYIESNGTQYIDTGYYWQNENIEIYFDGLITNNPSNQSLFGNEEKIEFGDRHFAGIPHGANGSYSIYLGTGSTISVPGSIGTRFNMNIKTKDYVVSVYKNGSLVDTKSYSGSVQTQQTAYLTSSASKTVGHIFIFANHNTSSGSTDEAIQNIGGMKLYSFKLTDNNDLVRDFVPCYRKSDRVAGLYDTVNDKFYTNSGTGEFILGPTVGIPESYQIVEYLQSSGTQYIDTGVPVTPNTTIEITAQILEGTVNNDSGNAEQISTQDYNLVGSYGSRTGLALSTLNGKLRFWNTAPQTQFFDYNTSDIYHIVLNNNGEYKVDNQTMTLSAYTVTANSNSIYLFSAQYLGNPGVQFKSGSMKLFGSKIYDAGKIVRDFVPCYRKSDNVAGIYDAINENFYINSGTGSFVVGPNIG